MLTPDEQQARWLEDASKSVKHSAFLMKRALDETNLRAALKYSSSMLNELRTGSLNPKTYYSLYIAVCDELRYLEVFFADENKSGRPNRELYESVQHAGNVLPRLYLLFTVGSVYIKSKEALAKDVLKDMVEMAKGVQHATRGLFLRAYLLQIAKDKLPDTGNEYEKQGEGGGVKDSVDFIIQNFTEMNKLWVRMQHQGAAADKMKREKERRELGLLVGMNLISLSQLEGLDKTMYNEEVLPRILEQLVNCKDQIAQQYLLDAIIQVFPDEFHLETLDALLSTLPQLQPTVKVHQSLSALIARLVSFVGGPAERSALEAADTYKKLAEAVEGLAGKFAGLSAADRASMFSSLLTFAMKMYPGELEHVNGIFGSCVLVFGEGQKIDDPAAAKELVGLIQVPIDAGQDLVSVAGMDNAKKLIENLDYDTRQELSVSFARKIVDEGLPLDTVDKVSDVFGFLQVMFSGEILVDKEDFAEEQSVVARMIVQLGKGVDSSEEVFSLLKAAMTFVDKGGSRRLPFTCPPMVFSILKLLRRVHEEASEAEGDGDSDGKKAKTASKKLLQMANTCLKSFATVSDHKPMLLRLYAAAAVLADECQQEAIAYDLFSQALMVYEEEISESREQVASLNLLISSVSRCQNFDEENRDSLVHKTTVFSSRLLRKEDQCRAACACSHLFWGSTPETQDGEAVMKCLKRAVKTARAFQEIASSSQDTDAETGPGSYTYTTKSLYVEILNKYIFFFDAGCASVTPTVLQGLIEVVKEEMADCDLSHDIELAAFYRNTIEHISSQKQKDECAERYAEIEV